MELFHLYNQNQLMSSVQSSWEYADLVILFWNWVSLTVPIAEFSVTVIQDKQFILT